MNLFFSGRTEAIIQPGMALKYGPWTWAVVLTTFAVIHYLLFGVVHNIVDMRMCLGYSPDPMLKIVPFDERWDFVTRDLYMWALGVATFLVFYQAFQGLHTTALRWGVALCIHTSMRMVTLLLIPLCRPTVQAFAPPPLSHPAMINLHFFSVPWRVFALNDVVYSGHTSVFLLLLLASGTWRPAVRFCFAGFLAVMIYGMLAMRDHYIIDILLAFPMSYFADSMAVKILRLANPARHATATQQMKDTLRA